VPTYKQDHRYNDITVLQHSVKHARVFWNIFHFCNFCFSDNIWKKTGEHFSEIFQLTALKLTMHLRRCAFSRYLLPVADNGFSDDISSGSVINCLIDGRISRTISTVARHRIDNLISAPG